MVQNVIPKQGTKHSSSTIAINSRNELVFITEDNTYTSSRTVAEIFGKQHKNVLQSIDLLKLDCPTDFTRLNFQPSYYKDKSGKKSKEYFITKNGLALLAMGFTGKKAMQFKISYINAFDQMQDIVTKRLYGDGVTLSELKRKVKWQTSWNLFANEDTPVYLLSEVLNYLGYKNMSQSTRIKYASMLKVIDGRIWAHEEFVKMKIKARAALNLRKQVVESCERIATAEIDQAKLIKQLVKKGGSHA